MHPIISQSPHHQDCLTKLHRVLDLALITAESASAEGNHKVVIQAAREVTRIVTMIHKMTATRNTLQTSSSPRSRKKGKPFASQMVPASSNQPLVNSSSPDECDPMEEISVPDLEALFPPAKVGAMDKQSQDLFKNISRNWSEFLALGEAAGLHLRPTKLEG